MVGVLENVQLPGKWRLQIANIFVEDDRCSISLYYTHAYPLSIFVYIYIYVIHLGGSGGGKKKDEKCYGRSARSLVRG